MPGHSTRDTCALCGPIRLPQASKRGLQQNVFASEGPHGAVQKEQNFGYPSCVVPAEFRQASGKLNESLRPAPLKAADLQRQLQARQDSLLAKGALTSAKFRAHHPYGYTIHMEMRMSWGIKDLCPACPLLSTKASVRSLILKSLSTHICYMPRGAVHGNFCLLSSFQKIIPCHLEPRSLAGSFKRHTSKTKCLHLLGSQLETRNRNSSTYLESQVAQQRQATTLTTPGLRQSIAKLYLGNFPGTQGAQHGLIKECTLNYIGIPTIF